MKTELFNTQKKLCSFIRLSGDGVKNFFTYDNKRWGNMSLISNPRALSKYERLFPLCNIKNREFIYLRPDHNDGLQHVTHKNLQVYRLFNAIKKDYSNLTVYPIHIDGIITKEKIPFIITPADCLILVLTAIDRKDKKRFIILIHAGMSGAYLNIHKKALCYAKNIYSFSTRDIEAFLFPSISEEHYKKPIMNNDLLPLLKMQEWKRFIVKKGKVVHLAFTRKIEYDLYKMGIKRIYSSGIDTYEAQKEGKLFSHVYQKRRKPKKSMHFAVVISL